MFLLHNLRHGEGASRCRSRVGRGGCSGGTSTRGNNGNKSRSGFKSKIGFEGGQISSYKRFPIIHSNCSTHKATITLDKILDIINSGITSIDRNTLISHKILSKSAGAYRIVRGETDFDKNVTIAASGFSKSSYDIIVNKNGGQCIVT